MNLKSAATSGKVGSRPGIELWNKPSSLEQEAYKLSCPLTCSGRPGLGASFVPLLKSGTVHPGSVHGCLPCTRQCVRHWGFSMTNNCS